VAVVQIRLTLCIFIADYKDNLCIIKFPTLLIMEPLNKSCVTFGWLK